MLVNLAVVLSAGAQRLVEMTQEREDSGQEPVAQFLLAPVSAGARHVPLSFDANGQTGPLDSR